MTRLLLIACAALLLGGCATSESIRILNRRIDAVRVDAHAAADRAYAMSQMTPAEAESIRLGARDVEVIKSLTELRLRVARSGYNSCQVDFKDLKEYVEDLQTQTAALRAANATLREQNESCRTGAGRIDGYWRKAQDEATFEKSSKEAAEKTNEKLKKQIEELTSQLSGWCKLTNARKVKANGK